MWLQKGSHYYCENFSFLSFCLQLLNVLALFFQMCMVGSMKCSFSECCERSFYLQQKEMGLRFKLLGSVK